MKQVTKYESDGVAAAQPAYDEGSARDGAQTTPRRLWWKNTSTASEVLEGCQVKRVAYDANDGLSYLELAPDVPVTPPAAPTLELAAGSGLEVGVYRYAVTLVNANGETTPGAEAQITTTSGNQQVQLSGIPTGPAGTTARRVYRTEVGSSQKKLAAVISDNTTTTLLDQAPDANLGVDAPSLNTSGSPGTWAKADLSIGDMAIGDCAGCWMRYNWPAGLTQVGNPRQAYVQFTET